MPPKNENVTITGRQQAVDPKQLQRVLESRIRGLLVTKVDNLKEKDVKIHPGKEWAFNLETKELVYQSEGSRSVSKLTEKEVVACMLHEISHAKFSKTIDYPTLSSIQSTMKKPNHFKEFITLVNAYEDIRIERLFMERHPGAYDSFRHVQKTAHERILSPEEMLTMEKQTRVLVNLFRKEWGYEAAPIDDDTDKIVEAMNAMKEEIVQAKETPKMASMIHAKVWPLYEKILDQQEGGKSNAPQKGEQESKPQNGQQPPQPQNQNQQPQQQPQQPQKKQNNVSDMQDILDELRQMGEKPEPEKGEEDEQEESDGNGSPQEQSFQEQIEQEIREQKHRSTSERSERFEESTEQIPNEGDWEEIKKTMEANRRYPDGLITYEQLLNKVSTYLPYFKRKIKSIMEDNQAKRFGGAFRSGNLNSRILYKFKCNSTKLFGKRIVRSHKNYAVCLLIDESGSMRGEQTKQATYSTVMLAETLNAANIPFEIVGFNTRMRQYKRLDEQFTWKVRRRLESMWIASGSSGAGATDDAYFLNKVSRTINKVEAERIIIVLSDGSPSPSGMAISAKDKKELKGAFNYTDDFDLKIEVMKASQHASVIGVGIRTDAVEDYYPNHVVCNDISTLPNMVLNILRGLIKRG